MKWQSSKVIQAFVHTSKGKVVPSRPDGSLVISASIISEDKNTLYNAPKSADLFKSRLQSANEVVIPNETIETYIRARVPQHIGEICSQELRTLNTN